jgi:hypothetical protein
VSVAGGDRASWIGLDNERAPPLSGRNQRNRTGDASASDAAFAERENNAMLQEAAY